ncbi:MAG: carboxymuconolactone decarboxylase family protein [Alphaproteobacteria bacterium]|nr:carboxymuconolactone decarboxylase family protein [Alphaproteobacteria bacterium]
MPYRVHTVETAPSPAGDMLAGIQKAFGFVPNMLGTMANSPPVLEAYQSTGALFDKTSLSATERQVVMLTTSAENGCEYCVGAHTALSAMQKVPDDVVQAIRNDTPIADPKLEALRRFSAEVVTTRGYPSAPALETLIKIGYGEQQVLEIILGVGLKSIANYINHIAKTQLDDAFAAVAWNSGN